MRILMIFHYSELMGGANFSGLHLLRGLRSLGHEVKVLVPTDGDVCQYFKAWDIEYKTIFFRQAYPYTLGSLSSYLKFFPRLLKERKINRKAIAEIEKWIREGEKPDLIHSNSAVMSIGYKVAQRLGIPHVTHFREFGFRDTGFAMWHIKDMLRYPRQINIAITGEIFRYHKLSPDNSEVIYNGIYSKRDYQEREEKKVAREEYLLYVGGLYRTKGIEEILEAYSKLDKSLRHKHPLLLAGKANSPKYDEYLHKKVKKLGISQNVEWLGPRMDVADLMKSARGLIIASRSEAFGRIMAEAAFNRCPVVALDRYGLHEQFEQGLKLTGKEIGFRVKTTEELHHKIEELLSASDEILSEMLDAGFRTAMESYTSESNAEKISDFYKLRIHETI